MKLSVVIPCYNEAEVLRYTYERLQHYLAELIHNNVIGGNYEIIFVDDASTDKTSSILHHLANTHKYSKHVKVITLNSNSGHQAALLAGIYNATGDAIISLDADSQDPPEYFENLISEYKKGNDIVIGIRSNRDTDTFFKRFFAINFYRVAKLLGVPGYKNAGDFRLISKAVQKSLIEYPERNLYLRGLIPSMKFKTSTIYYKRQPRVAGTTKYTFAKSLNLAIDGITSFSIRPLRIVGIVGILMFIISILYILVLIYMKLFTNLVIQGWTTIMVAVVFLQSINFIFLAVIGEYLGKTYIETKQRPRYIVKDKVNF